MTPLCFSRYSHTLRMAYSFRGLRDKNFEKTLISYASIQGKSPLEVTQIVLPTIRERLDHFGNGLADTILPQAQLRTVEINDQFVYWPMVNQQGLEWYREMPLVAFDFFSEAKLGLHENARVIYDFGGHHGLWAQYYSMIVGSNGRVYSFEPSIINIEVSSLLFLINSVSNVVNVAMAIGSGIDSTVGSRNMLVDFVELDTLEVVDLRNISWDYADFLKMDIEGFEYDVITNNPWMFELAKHMHIEVHIPHLIRRGLDYRKIIDLIPFDKFDVFNHQLDSPVFSNTQLEGFCGLLFRRKN